MNPLRTMSSRVECLRTMHVLQRYLDGAVDDASAQRVAAHLEHCRRCGLEAEVYGEIKASLARGERPVDPDAVERLRRFGERLAHDGGPVDGETGA